MLFSIITVCYNSAKTIRRTFDSVLAQDFDDYEYIVIDGASTDGTVEIIKEFEPKFGGRMRWISEPDDGIYDAMNKGIRMARGEIIGIVNSDDFYEPDVLKNLAVQLKKQKADVCYGCLRLYDNNGFIRIMRCPHQGLIHEPMMHPACFISKNAYDRFGFYDTSYRIAADYELLLKMFLNGAEFMAIEQIFTNFSETGISTSNWLTGKMEEIAIRRRYGLTSYVRALCEKLKYSGKYLFRRFGGV